MPPINLIHAQFPMDATQDIEITISPQVYGTVTLYG